MIMDWRHALLLATSTGVSDNAGFNPMLLSRKPKSGPPAHKPGHTSDQKTRSMQFLFLHPLTEFLST